MKDWSPPEVERVFAALSDWREQFTEHKNKVMIRKRLKGWGEVPVPERGDIILAFATSRKTSSFR